MTDKLSKKEKFWYTLKKLLMSSISWPARKTRQNWK